MIKLYMMNVSPLYGDELFLRSLTLISDGRRGRALRFKRRSDAALSIGSELLLRYALIRDFGIKELPAFFKTERGKPYFENPQGIYFSLSHSGEYAVCLISDEGDAGVDIQLVRRVDMKTAKRVLSEKAYAQLEAAGESGRDERFCELWVLHESAVKLRGGSVFDAVDTNGSRLVEAPAGYKAAVTIGNKGTNDDGGHF